MVVSGLSDEDWLTDNDNSTATTADLTTLAGNGLDSDLDLEDKEDFAAENIPRLPPEEIFYHRQGTL